MALSTLKETDPTALNTGINKKNRAEVAEQLSRLLADTYTLYLKTQYYHWNVTGPHFSALHALFENQYTDLQQATDEMAERIRALGHFTPGTFREFLDVTEVKEDKSLPSDWKAMVKNLVAGHETISRFLGEAITSVQEQQDEVTADLFIGRKSTHEKAAWMLRSHLE